MMPMKTSNFSPFELNAGIPPMLQIKNKSHINKCAGTSNNFTVIIIIIILTVKLQL